MQGGLDYTQSGFYLGTWGSNVETSRTRRATWRSTVRWLPSAASATISTFDVGSIQYWYPGESRPRTTTELKAALGWK